MFPLERMEVKTKPINDGANIVVELNEEDPISMGKELVVLGRPVPLRRLVSRS